MDDDQDELGEFIWEKTGGDWEGEADESGGESACKRWCRDDREGDDGHMGGLTLKRKRVREEDEAKERGQVSEGIV